MMHLHSMPGRLRMAGRVLLLCLAMCTMGTTPNVSATSGAMSREFLNLRESPVSTSSIIAIVPPNAALTVTGEASGIYLPVTYGEVGGWAASDLLDVEQGQLAESLVMPDRAGQAILVEALNLRLGPGIDFDSIQVVPAGTEVDATGEFNGRYQKIKVGGKEGWVRSIYIDSGPQPNSDAGPMVVSAGSAGGLGTESTQARTVAEIVMRAEPTPGGSKVAVVPFNATLQLTGARSGGFVEAQFEAKRGWVSSDYLDLAADNSTGPDAIPVLMYHSIQADPAAYQVTEPQLDEQLAWLARSGYASITGRDLLAWLTAGVPLPEKPVMITIDDGNSSDWKFLELLERYGHRGVFSLPNYATLSAEQIRTLSRAGEICGHTVSHENLSTLSYDEQVSQISDNKKFLEEILGTEITCFAYPFGAYSGLTPFVAIEAGYLLAFDVEGGVAPLDGSLDRWHVQRINISGHYTLDDFITALEA